MFPDLKRGDLVEFVEFGSEFCFGDDESDNVAVFTGQRQDDELIVESANGKTTVHASNVLAYGIQVADVLTYGWPSWVTDNLEDIWEQYNEHEDLDP